MARSPILGPSFEAATDPDLAAGYYRGEEGTTEAFSVPAPAIPQAQDSGAPVGFNYDTGEMWVNGVTFDAQNHKAALEAKEALNRPEQRNAPLGFAPIEPERWNSYLNKIQDPSLGRLFGKNVDIGTDALQMLGYGAIQAAGAGIGIEAIENFGAEGVERNVQELSYNEPYQRRFTGAESVGDYGEWFVANAGQLAPSIVETIAAAGIGAVLGAGSGAVGGPVGLVGGGLSGAVAGFGAKQAAKQKLKERVYRAIAKRRAGEQLLGPEKKLLRQVGAAGGAATASAINSYGIGVGDIYTESVAEGDPNLMGALFGAVPYAAADLLPGAIAVSAAGRALRAGVKQQNRGTRALIGGVGGAAIEGGAEGSQEAIVMGLTGQLDFNDPEVIDRLIDAFAAGAGMGGPIGAFGGALGQRGAKPPREINDPDQQADLLGIEQDKRLAIEDMRPGDGPIPQGGPDAPAGLLTNDVDEAAAAEQNLATWTAQVEQYQQNRETIPEAVLNGYRNAVARYQRTQRGGVDVQTEIADRVLPGNDPRAAADVSPQVAQAESLLSETTLLQDKAQRAAALAQRGNVSLDQQQRAAEIASGAADQLPLAAAEATFLDQQQQNIGDPAMEARTALVAQQAQQAAQQARAQSDAATQAVTQRRGIDRLRRAPVRVDQTPLQQPPVVQPNTLQTPEQQAQARDKLASIVAQAQAGRPSRSQGELFLRRGGKRTAPQPTAQAQQRPAEAEAEEVARQQAEEQARQQAEFAEAMRQAAEAEAAAEKLGAGGSPSLAAMSQEEYAAHLAETGLPEGVSAYDALTASPELRGLNAQQRVDLYNKSKDAAKNFTARMSTLWMSFRGTTGGVRAIGADSGWTNFEVGTDRASDGQVRHKSYASLSDFINITNEELTGFLEAMDMLGFNGQVKFPGMGSRALLGFDNIVMHGATQRDALLGQKIAQDYFGGRVTGTQVGADANGKSHTQLMADALEATNAKQDQKPSAAGVDTAEQTGTAGSDGRTQEQTADAAPEGEADGEQGRDQQGTDREAESDTGPDTATESELADGPTGAGEPPVSPEPPKQGKSDVPNRTQQQQTDLARDKWDEMVAVSLSIDREADTLSWRKLTDTPDGRRLAKKWTDRVMKAERGEAKPVTVADYYEVYADADTIVRKPNVVVATAVDTLNGDPTADEIDEAIDNLAEVAFTGAHIKGEGNTAAETLMSDTATMNDNPVKSFAAQDAIAEQIRKAKSIPLTRDASVPVLDSGGKPVKGADGKPLKTTENVLTNAFKLISHFGLYEVAATDGTLTDFPTEETLGVDAEMQKRIGEMQATMEAHKVEGVRKGPDPKTQALIDGLQEIVDDMMAGGVYGVSSRYILNKDLSDLIKGADTTALFHGAPISKWLEDDGKSLIWSKVRQSNRYELTTSNNSVSLMGDFIARMDAGITAGSTYRVGTDEVIDTPIGKGAARSYLANLRMKLKGKPYIRLYKNVAELKRKDPELYREAAAARPQGDFDTIRAAGYSFDKKVIIFSDHIRSRQELAFVAMHEIIGHYGMRSVFSPAEYKRLLNQAYDADISVRREHEQFMMSNPGIDPMEALEEVVANRSAHMANGVLYPLIDALKRAITKVFGYKFDDDILRMMVRQSRRYVRYGMTGETTIDNLAKEMREEQEAYRQGRFSVASDLSVYDQLGGSRGAMSSLGTGLMGKMENFLKFTAEDIRNNRGKNVGETFKNNLGYAAEKVQTFANFTHRSVGALAVFRVFQDQTHYVRARQFELADLLKVTNSANWWAIGDKLLSENGPTKQQKLDAGKILAYLALYQTERITEKQIEGGPDIIKIVDGEAVVDQKAINELRITAGILRRDDKGKVVSNIPALKELFSEGIQFQRFDATTGKPVLDNDGQPTYETVSGFNTTDDTVWTIVEENRNAVDKAAEMHVKSHIQGLMDERRAMRNSLFGLKVKGGKITREEVQFFDDVGEAYKRIYEDADRGGTAEAREFLRQVTKALHDDKKFKDWQQVMAGTLKDDDKGEIVGTVQKDTKQFESIFRGIERTRQRGFSKDTAFELNQTIQEMYLNTTLGQNANALARRTILQAYVPFVRKGDYQVKMMAVDRKGRETNLADVVSRRLPYFKVQTAAQAKELAATLERDVLSGEFSEYQTIMGVDDVKHDVKLVVQWEEAPDVPPIHDAITMDQFLRTARRMGIDLSPENRAKVIRNLTDSNSKARKTIQRQGKLGWSEEVVEATAEHLEMVTHIAGKNRYRHRLDDIMMRKSNWFGQEPEAKAELKRLQDKYVAAKNSGNNNARLSAHRDLAAYQHRMIYMTESNQSVPIMSWEGEINQVEGKGRAQRYLLEARRLIAFYDTNMEITGAVEGKLNELAGGIMSWAATAQLGAAMATAAVNLGSLGTHAVPYLASYNKKMGYGGGFSVPAATVAVAKASRDMSGLGAGARRKDALKLAEPAFLESLAKGEKYKQYNLSKAEYDMVLELTKEGVLNANMFNAMIGTSRSDKRNPKLARFMETYMIPFTYTEQLNRRATALASYRLERARMEAQGVKFDGSDKAKKAEEQLRHLATDAVNFSQGEYAHYNRPTMARGNIFQFPFMYKQFVIITVENMRNMGWGGTAATLGMLVFMSGMKGVPFGEDIMDIVDTLAQKFNIPIEPVEVEIRKGLNDIVDGMGDVLMSGAADKITGIPLGARFGMGDILPMTGSLLAGANLGREATNFAGPAFSFIGGALTFANNAVKYGAETLGILPDTTTLSQLFRDQPFAAIRNASEAVGYLSDGSVVNSRGQVVAKDMTAMDAIVRMVGFYPKDAADQYAAIKRSEQIRDYAAALKMEYTNAYIRAAVAKDQEGQREIIEAVRKWNQNTRGTPFYFRNFSATARRAAKEGTRTAIDRLLRSTAKQQRLSTREIISLYGLDDISEAE